MTAYAIVTLTVEDADGFADYRAKAGPAMAKHKAEPLQVSNAPTLLEGTGDTPEVAVLLGFPDRDAALAWYNDPEVAEIHAKRRDSTNSRIVLL